MTFLHVWRNRRVSSPLRKGSRVVAASAVAGALLAGIPSPAPAATASPQTIRVGSYNVRAGVSTAAFRHAVVAFSPDADVVGLQEVNSKDKEAVLASMRSSGWSYYRSKPGEQNPVMWRRSRFRLVSGRTVRILGERYIGNELAGRGGYAPAIYVSVVRLRDRQTGGRVSVLNVHLVPGAVINGHPTAGRPRLFDAYRDSVIGLGGLVNREQSFGRMFVLGDFNVGWVADKRTHHKHLPYETFKRHGMRSMWATERPSGRGSHKDSPALIDQVYSAVKARTATVHFGITYSDHFPVVATYPGSATKM